jgi:hypothetical protein
MSVKLFIPANVAGSGEECLATPRMHAMTSPGGGVHSGGFPGRSFTSAPVNWDRSDRPLGDEEIVTVWVVNQ